MHGDEVLAARGIDTDAPDDALLANLVAQIGADPDADLAIADLIGSIPLQEAADHLMAWQRRDPPDKHLRRVIRQSLFRLEQRGLRATPSGGESPAPRPAPAAGRAALETTPTGYLSPIDGGGNRLAWISLTRPEGGFFVLRSVISDEAGMRQVGASHMNRTQFREERAHTARYGATMVEAPHEYVDWLMSDAHARGAPREGGVSYPLMRGEIYSGPSRPVASPAADRLGDFPENRIDALIASSGDLFKEREFHGWVIAEQRVQSHLDRFREARESTIVLDRRQTSDRLRGIIDAAFEECFPDGPGGARPIYAARLAEMALWYALAARADEARTCWAVHRALEDAGRRLGDCSFLRALVFRAFLHLMPRDSGGEEDAAGSGEGPAEAGPGEPPLIVRPE